MISKMNKLLLSCSLILGLISCRSSSQYDRPSGDEVHFNTSVGILKVHEGERLQIIWNHNDTAEWSLPYPVYHWEVADFDRDGNDEIFVGVCKATRFDPEVRKRLFIFKIVDFEIRPLWMGSKVVYPLLSFTVKEQNDATYIITKELKSEFDTLSGFYVKAPFGISWVKHENFN